jgi:hypothetical protein
MFYQIFHYLLKVNPCPKLIPIILYTLQISFPCLTRFTILQFYTSYQNNETSPYETLKLSIQCRMWPLLW